MQLDTLTALFGWCSVINIAILLFSTLLLTAGQKTVVALHCRITGVAATQLPGYYFHFLANYKMATLIFNLAPYLALRIIS